MHSMTLLSSAKMRKLTVSKTIAPNPGEASCRAHLTDFFQESCAKLESKVEANQMSQSAGRL